MNLVRYEVKNKCRVILEQIISRGVAMRAEAGSEEDSGVNKQLHVAR